MELHTHMAEIADQAGLPGDHPIRITAEALRNVLALKGKPDFPELLFDAEANALAAYAAYTGKPFVNTDEDE